MNAYELADSVEDWESGANYTVSIKAAQMLRQQADRITELEKSAEPVAWIKKDTLIFLGNYEFGSITIQVQKQKDDEFDIPLYTTPQIKELSDEEIEYYEHLIAKLFNVSIQQKVIGLDRIIRAILKKASER